MHWHRYLTHALVHAHVPHMLLNLVSFVGFGPYLERFLGSVQLLYVTALLAVVPGFIYCALAYAMYMVPGMPFMLNACLVGFSGTLFGLLVLYVYQFLNRETVKLLGIVAVPSIAVRLPVRTPVRPASLTAARCRGCCFSCSRCCRASPSLVTCLASSAGTCTCRGRSRGCSPAHSCCASWRACCLLSHPSAASCRTTTPMRCR